MKKINEEEETKRLNEMLKFEKSLYEEGLTYICGVDEAGRGPLVGPVVAAAVVLNKNEIIYGVNDSKKLSEKKREELFDEIMNKAVSVGIGVVDEKTIDEINILEATRLAMKQAIESLTPTPEHCLIDAEKKLDISMPYTPIIKGDALSESIAAASIIAKVTRDRMIKNISLKYPEYNLAKNKGYGTKEHIDAIKKYGLSDIHRRTFCTHFVK